MTTGEGGPVFSKAKHPNQSDYIQPLVKIWPQVQERTNHYGRQTILTGRVKQIVMATGEGEDQSLVMANHPNQAEFSTSSAATWYVHNCPDILFSYSKSNFWILPSKFRLIENIFFICFSAQFNTNYITIWLTLLCLVCASFFLLATHTYVIDLSFLISVLFFSPCEGMQLHVAMILLSSLQQTIPLKPPPPPPPELFPNPSMSFQKYLLPKHFLSFRRNFRRIKAHREKVYFVSLGLHAVRHPYKERFGYWTSLSKGYSQALYVRIKSMIHWFQFLSLVSCSPAK
jgi:hypothetical protein